MKEVKYIYDSIVPATRELEVLLNKGYEVVTSSLFTFGPEDDYELNLQAVLVKEE